VIYRDPITHAAENIGDKPMHLILVELKSHWVLTQGPNESRTAPRFSVDFKIKLTMRSVRNCERRSGRQARKKLSPHDFIN